MSLRITKLRVVLFRLSYRHIFNIVNGKSGTTILNVHSLKYPVTFTKHIQLATNKLPPKFNTSQPTILIFAAGQSLDDYTWLQQYLSQYTDVLTLAHSATPHISNAQNSIQQYKTHLNDFQIDIDMIKNAMDHFNIKQANFVGISFGGFLSYLFAAQYPSMVNSMLLNSTGLYVSNSCKKDIAQGMEYLINNDYKQAGKLIAKAFTTQRKLRRVLSKYFATLFASSEVYRHQFVYHTQRVLNASYPDNVDFDRNVKTRTLSIWGKSDSLFPFNSSMRLAKTISNCIFATVNGDHLWQLYSQATQAVFCEIIIDFLMHSEFENDNNYSDIVDFNVAMRASKDVKSVMLVNSDTELIYEHETIVKI